MIKLLKRQELDFKLLQADLFYFQLYPDLNSLDKLQCGDVLALMK